MKKAKIALRDMKHQIYLADSLKKNQSYNDAEEIFRNAKRSGYAIGISKEAAKIESEIKSKYLSYSNLEESLEKWEGYKIILEKEFEIKIK